jgi:hypothetical protein
MADKKKAAAGAAPAAPAGPDFAAMNMHLQTSLAVREDMRSALEERVARAEARAADAERAAADAEAAARDAAAESVRRARERETALLAEKAAADADVKRLKELVFSMEFDARATAAATEKTLAAKDAAIAALRSRLDDVTAEFMERLASLFARMQEKIELVVPEAEAGTRGVRVKDSTALLQALSATASIEPA